MSDSKVVAPAARKPPNAGMGRKPGVPNKTTAALKDAVLLAAEEIGVDGEGKDGLKGYLKMLAMTEPKAYAGLLGKIIPLQINGHLQHELISKEQRDAAVAAAIRADS